MILSSTSPYALLKEFSIACGYQKIPFFVVVPIYSVHDFMRIYILSISDPLNSFRQ